MDVAESRAINNLQIPYHGNFAGTGYGNILGSANLNGVNKFQNNALNQINNHGNYPTAVAGGGFSTGMNKNLKLQNQLTQQGAKMKNLKRKQSLLQLQQENQQLQNIRMLQKQQEIQKKEKLNQLKRNKFANTYTANNEQNALFNKLKSKKTNSMPSNTFRKSEILQKKKVSQIPDYGFYDYDTDYYDLG